MRLPWADRLSDRTSKRASREQAETFEDIFGPRSPSTIEGWDRPKLINMLTSNDLAPNERFHAEVRLRMLEQEDGPAGRSAKVAVAAFWISLASLALAGAALWKSFYP